MQKQKYVDAAQETLYMQKQKYVDAAQDSNSITYHSLSKLTETFLGQPGSTGIEPCNRMNLGDLISDYGPSYLSGKSSDVSV